MVSVWKSIYCYDGYVFIFITVSCDGDHVLQY